ncbi:MAG: hypothetical protein QOI95_1143 [Acidimicrobiaceae bacterium]|jgi:hypothetical protein
MVVTMAISFELQAHSEAPADHVFRTIADLRSWDAFAGVVLVGPERTVTVDDRIDVRLRVVRRDIRMGCIVRSVDEPTHDTAGSVDLRSVEGPFDARMIGLATPTSTGCDVGVEVHGIGRGPARMLERPVEIVMRQWAAHQMRHLLDLATASSISVGAIGGCT